MTDHFDSRAIRPNESKMIKEQREAGNDEDERHHRYDEAADRPPFTQPAIAERRSF